jgi:hypothetical protein
MMPGPSRSRTRVHVVGCAGHQVTDLAHPVDARGEPGDVVEEVVAQLVLHASRGADQRHAHGVEEETLEQDSDHDQRRVAEQLLAGHSRLDVVHRLSNQPRRPDLEQRRQDHGQAAQDHGGLVPTQVREEVSKRSDGRVPGCVGLLRSRESIERGQISTDTPAPSLPHRSMSISTRLIRRQGEGREVDPEAVNSGGHMGVMTVTDGRSRRPESWSPDCG